MALEYEDVLKRGGVIDAYTQTEIDDFLAYFFGEANLVSGVHSLRPNLPDPGDESILEPAVVSRAMIVTHNAKHFLAAARLGIAIKTPVELLGIWRKRKRRRSAVCHHSFVRVCLFLLALSCVSQAQDIPSEFVSVPKADAPELAPPGHYAVGVRTLDVVHPGQIDILNFKKDTGKASLYDRPLKVEVWYPAALAPGQEQRVIYPSAMPGRAPRTSGPKGFEFPGKAARDAAPLPGQKFPLVIVSHGYPGSRYFLTYLTENLASKGYVVAAIDHTDSVFGEVRDFSSTLLNRSNDQLFVLSSLQQLAKSSSSFLSGLLQENNAAIVGYSMGGYGALISAGAGISESSLLNKLVPGGYLAAWNRESPTYQALPRDGLKAIVAIAPWGEQPPFNAWDSESLAGIRLPALFIVGDHDDVAGYDAGPKRAMQLAVHSDRCLLVYENARHNTGGNPPPAGVALDYQGLQSFDEPVWRKDRIAAINQHFITAFLDLNLKGDQTRRAFLHVPVPNSNDGKWQAPANAPDTGTFSKGDGFWPGFQRRWALGLEMSCYAPGEAAKP